VYRGKQAKTGNSLGFRFDHSLFKSHPEFSGEVEAHVLGPGRMLVVATQPGRAKQEEDPVVATFVNFLAADMQRFPHRIQPLDAGLIARIEKLTQRVITTGEEALGDEALL
jgi:antitoxin PrlF